MGMGGLGGLQLGVSLEELYAGTGRVRVGVRARVSSA